MDILHNLQWVLPLRSPALTQFAVGFSWLGYTTFIIFFIAIGYLQAHTSLDRAAVFVGLRLALPSAAPRATEPAAPPLYAAR